jgi:enterochelin esterase-like enzyme
MYRTMRSDALRDVWAEYGVYAPVASAEERLPLVVFLHGGGDGPDCLDKHGIAERFDRAIEEGRLPRAVIAVPEGHLGFWTNWYDGSRRYEDWVIDEVMPAVSRRYHTLACPAGCFIMGVSMGAEGALRMSIHRPHTFAGLISISGPSLDTARRIAFLDDPLIRAIIPTHHVFGPAEPRSRIEADDPFLRWMRPEDLQGMRVFLAWAEHDRQEIREGGTALDAHLRAHEIPHETRVFPGGHDWISWGPILEEALAVELGSMPLDATAPR